MGLSDLEWKELNRLRREISANPAAVCAEDQERFTTLFVASLVGKGDRMCDVITLGTYNSCTH